MEKAVLLKKFSNGLEITDSYVRLGEQTWALEDIKRVGRGRAGGGGGITGCLLLFPVFLFLSIFIGIGMSYDYGLFNFLGVLLPVVFVWGVFQVFSSANKLFTSKVWIETDSLSVDVFVSRDEEEAILVRKTLEKAIGNRAAAGKQ